MNSDHDLLVQLFIYSFVKKMIPKKVLDQLALCSILALKHVKRREDRKSKIEKMKMRIIQRSNCQNLDMKEAFV